jgi:hypothetical protein
VLVPEVTRPGTVGDAAMVGPEIGWLPLVGRFATARRIDSPRLPRCAECPTRGSRPHRVFLAVPYPLIR